ncbi:GerAB/ArcD/ProY family transporter [Marinisporobacter balticus]|uniref:Spore germination protein KB n=1 Tax=Marinisporobacter balticus TaxID=2018667 RepID=A0A4R2LF95_9FIRM|nr:GerAB/ArcD/ProY family transporter [Marinisporobacter balticus]TCO77925.1 spore germination protein KB [Marinisporobacter balticus]
MKKSITGYQLFIMMVLLPYGSAVLHSTAPETKQDAWIVILFYSLSGIIIQLIYTTLYNFYPNDTLVTYMPKIYGKYFGNIISVSYITLYAYMASRNLRDIQEIIYLSSLDSTPIIVTGIFLMVLVLWGVSNGLSNMSNFTQLFFPIIILAPIVVWILSILTPDYINLYRLKPILSQGFINLIVESWHLIGFPYGETMVFAMIFPFVFKHNNIKKIAIASIIFEGIILSINSILFVTTIGIESSTNQVIPFLQVVRNIKIDFIMGIDIILLIILVLGGFFKVFMFTYCAILGASQLLRFKYLKTLYVTTGMVILILSMSIAENYLQHVKIGTEVSKYIFVPFATFVPAFTLLTCSIKNSNAT